MYHHISVLKKEVIKHLAPRPGQNFIDCTLGGAGQAAELAEKVRPSGKVLGIDLDEAAVNFVRTKKIPNLIIVRDNYKNLEKIKNAKFNHPINGILLDLGLSSAQIESSGRGFSFLRDEKLDMRFTGEQKTEDRKRTLTAKDIINQWPEQELCRIFKEYGEEPRAKKIAKVIIKHRKIETISTTGELLTILMPIVGQNNKVNKKSFPAKGRGKHPATRVFQALRLAVNNELENLKQILPQCVQILEPGGRLAIISFHSLEDRLVKNFFRRESRACLCPPRFPVCQCQHQAALKIITKKPVIPSASEVSGNPRSRSAKLRVAERI